MKVVFIEPNLKTMSGHVFEATKTLIDYFATNKKCFETHFVCHHQVNQEVLTRLNILHPLYALSCFEKGNTNLLYKSVENIIKIFELCRKDIVIFTTSHLRDLDVVNKYAKDDSPRYILQFHQFYPPMVDSDQISDNRTNNNLNSKYKRIFSNINRKKTRVVVTPVKALSRKIFTLTGYQPQMLSVPFSPPLQNIEIKKDNKLIRIGFFGDSRKEKGVLDFLRTVKILIELNSYSKYYFDIQIQNPRGFTTKELLELKNTTNYLTNKRNVNIILGELNTKEYYEHLIRCDIICILHHPDHYSIRLSGIAVECGILGKWIITREGTSISEWIIENKLFGEIIADNKTDSIVFAINKIEQKKFDPIQILEMNKMKKYWANKYSANNYVNQYLLPIFYNEWK